MTGIEVSLCFAHAWQTKRLTFRKTPIPFHLVPSLSLQRSHLCYSAVCADVPRALPGLQGPSRAFHYICTHTKLWDFCNICILMHGRITCACAEMPETFTDVLQRSPGNNTQLVAALVFLQVSVGWCFPDRTGYEMVSICKQRQ